MKSITLYAFLCITIFSSQNLLAQLATIILGFGSYDGLTVTASENTQNSEKILDQIGYLPNQNAASRFLT